MDRQLSRVLISIARNFWLFVAAQILVTLIWAVDISLRPYIAKVLLDKLSTFQQGSDVNGLIICGGAYLFVGVFIAFTFRFYEWIILCFHPQLKQYVAMSLMDNMMKHPHRFYLDHFSGNLAKKVSDISHGFPDLFNALIDQFLSHFLALVIATYTVALVSLTMALFLVAWIVVFFVGSMLLSTQARLLSHQTAEAYSNIAGHHVDILGNMMNVRLFNGRLTEMQFLNKQHDQAIKVERAKDWHFMSLHGFQETSFFIFQCLCFWWLLLGVQDQTVTVGDCGLILMLNISIVNCLHTLSRNIRSFADAFGRVSQGLQIICTPLDMPEKCHAKQLFIGKGEVVFRAVQFSYVAKEPLFDTLSVKIAGGQKVGLVGYSGSGKSSFVNLLLRLFDVLAGEILIDGCDIRDVTQKSLYRSISVIPQDLMLFNRTVMENIRYSRPSATDEEVILAAKAASAHRFIEQLPQGYNTQVGDRGIRLSGGERQRIAIARAFLKQAPILILDEATSQLDSITENQIQESLQKLMQGKTTIVIAHRLSTVMSMDRLLVFQQGRLIQDGSHEVLLKQTGLYQKLWQQQVGGFLAKSVRSLQQNV